MKLGESSMKRFLSILSAGALALVGAVTFVSPSQAATCSPVVTAVQVNEVIIYAETPSRAKASLTAYDPCGDYDQGIWWVDGEAYASGTHFFDMSGAETHSSAKTTWTGTTSADFDTWNTTGLKTASFEVYDQDVNKTVADTFFYVRRNVYFSSHNASPEPVRKGSPIKVAGSVRKLVVNSYHEGRYVPYRGHLMRYYFRAKGTSSYVLKGESYTNDFGNFAKSFTASVDGYWYARSTQTTVNRGRNGTPDFVDVI